jgi:hypothetical protein
LSYCRADKAFMSFLSIFLLSKAGTLGDRNSFCPNAGMQKLTLTEPTSQRKPVIELRVASINRNQTEQEEFTEKHFTKAITGEPGVNAPARNYYPRSYSADGPGGNYQGL